MPIEAIWLFIAISAVASIMYVVLTSYIQDSKRSNTSKRVPIQEDNAYKFKIPRDYESHRDMTVKHPILGDILFRPSFTETHIAGVFQEYVYNVRYKGDTLYIYKAEVRRDKVIWDMALAMAYPPTLDELGVILGECDNKYDPNHMLRHKLGI